MDVSGQPIVPAFMCRESKKFLFLSPKDGAASLSRNVGNKLPLVAAK